MDIKELFSALPLTKLRELAKQHNIQTMIKSPSNASKSELVFGLAKHFVRLENEKLLPREPFPLSLPLKETPSKFKPKTIVKPKNPSIVYKDVDPELMKLQLAKVKSAYYDIARENRESRAMQYATQKKYEESVAKTKARQEREKAKRQAKKQLQQQPSINIIEPKQVKEDDKKSALLIEFEKMAEQVRKLKTLNENSKLGKVIYGSNSRKQLILDKALKNAILEKTITKKEINKIEKLADEVAEILDTDEIFEKFNE